MKKSFFLRVLTVAVAIIMAVMGLPLFAFAETVQATAEEVLYVKELRIAQAETEAEARISLENDGYVFVEGNLNEGTGEEGIWLGYKTTADPAEAVYDIRLMNTDGGYTLTSMEEAIKSQETAFTEMAVDLEMLIKEFVTAYENKLVSAQKAYKALNFFRLVEGEDEDELLEENGLGYHLVHGSMSTRMITEMIMFCDSAVVDSIVKILTMGIQLKNESWIKKLSKLGPYDSETDYTKDEKGKVRFTEDEIKRRAKQLETVIKFYADAYIAFDELGLVSGKLDENFNITDATYKTPSDLTADELSAKKADESRYKFYKVVFDELASYSYGKAMTLKDLFLDEPVTEDLYPLVSVLSDGEFAAMSYGCFLEVAIGANSKTTDFDRYDEAYETATEEVKSFYLYEGVDKALMSDDVIVGFTDSATRHMAATGEMEFYENETFSEEALEKGIMAAKVIGVMGLAVIGVSRVAMGAAILTNAIITAAAGVAIKSTVYSGIIKVCSIIGGPWTLLITVAAAAITALVSWLISVISEEINGKIDWDDNPMPEYLYDVRKVSFSQKNENEGIKTDYVLQPVFCFYEAVLDENGQVADLNARSDDAAEWIGIYVSYDRLGDSAKPIKAEGFKVQTGNGETPKGYKPLTRFDEIVAYNLNQRDDNDEVNGVYAFYKQDEEAPPVAPNETYYISDIYLQKGESDAHCIALLEAKGYTPYNVNLTPLMAQTNEPLYTYIGYKTTTAASEAYRDLRIVYGAPRGEIQLGGATYADCGSNGWVTLYATKYLDSGSPILAGGLKVVNHHKDAPVGYEPVNLFNGGPAVSLDLRTYEGGDITADVHTRMEQQLLYFLPATSFTSGTTYIGGISYFGVSDDSISYFKRSFGTPPEQRKQELLSVMSKVTGEEEYSFLDYETMLSNFLLARSGYHRLVDVNLMDTVAYYYTYNPYRAIYDIKMTTVENSEYNFRMENIGYVKWSAVMQDDAWDMRYREINPLLDNEVDLNGDFFVSGNPIKGNEYDKSAGAMTKVQPLTIEDVICLTDYNVETQQTYVNKKELSYKAVDDEFQGGNPKITNEEADDYGSLHPQNHFTFYVKRSSEEERPYVANILVADELTMYRSAGGADAGIKREHITDGLLYRQLAAAGATDFCGHRVTMGQPDFDHIEELNALRFAFVRSDDSEYALRDIFIQVNDFSFDEPPEAIYRGNIKYVLICEIPYNLTGYDGAPSPGVWIYGTTDERAGAEITDFEVSPTPFKDGYETVRTKSGRSPWAELRDMMEANEKKHFLSWAAELFEDLKDFFGIMDKDENIFKNYFEHEPYYFHIKRKGDSITEQKPYVEKLYLADFTGHKAAALDKLFDQGAEAYIDADLNKEAGGKYIYLGYSRTESVKKSIKDIYVRSGANPVETATANDGRIYSLVKNLDLNRGAGGDYLYLYTTKEGSTPVMELSVGYEARNIGKIRTEKGANDRDIEVHDWVAQKWNEAFYSNLNSGAGGSHVYLFYKKVYSGAEDGSYKAPNFDGAHTYTRSGFDKNYIDPNGKYIAEIYVMDKETIRKELGYSYCYSVSDKMVFDRLTEMGATEIIKTPISVNSRDFDIWNENKVYVGYSRTNDADNAIRSVVLNVELIASSEPPESIDVNKRSFKLVAEAANNAETLPRAVNLLSIGDGNQVPFPKMYLYTLSTGTLPPITDICIDKSPLRQGWNTVRSQNGLDPFVDISKQANEQYLLADKDDLDSRDEELVYTDSLFEWMDDLSQIFEPAEENVTVFYMHTKNYETATVADARPYVEKVFIASGDTRHEALTKLVAFDPDEFVDIDLNQRAGGRYVYLAYKRTDKASAAIRDLMIYEGKNPENIRRIMYKGERIRYDLVANVDLNEKAGGKYLYLYYSDSKRIGKPVKSIGVAEDDIPAYTVSCGTERNQVLLAERNKDTNEDQFTKICIDLNRGAGGDYLYMYMYRETTAGHALIGYRRYTEHKDATCGDDGYDLIRETCVFCWREIETKTVYEATGKHFDSDGDGDHRCDVCRQRDVTSCIRGVAKEENIVAPYKDEEGNLIDGRCNHVSRCVECKKVLSTDRNIVIPATAENIAKYAAKTTSSIFANGSVTAICVFIGAGALVAVTIPILKKKKSNKQKKG